MATPGKKTPAKKATPVAAKKAVAVSKPVPAKAVKAPVAKPVKAERPLKIHDKGSYTKRDGTKLTGKIVDTVSKTNGLWITVRPTGEKGNANDSTIRASQFTRDKK